MFFRQSRKLTIPLFFLAALLLVVLLVGIASAEEFTPAMIRRFSPAMKLLLTDDGKDTFGQGTGFFISPDGHMLTNYHVVEDSKKIVIFEDEKVYEVKRVIDFNEEADVALLETDYPRSKIHYLPLRTTLIEMGESIMVLGYPKATELGTEITSTKGNVSSIRSAGVNSLVQFTAPVAGGSSGSPIIDTNGEVAGIVTSELTFGQGMFLGLSSPSITRHVGRHIPTRRTVVAKPTSMPTPKPQTPTPPPSEINLLPVDGTSIITTAEIHEALAILNELGFNAGVVGRMPRSQTASSVKAFQRYMGVAQDGKLTIAVLEMLREAKKQRIAEEAKAGSPLDVLFSEIDIDKVLSSAPMFGGTYAQTLARKKSDEVKTPEQAPLSFDRFFRLEETPDEYGGIRPYAIYPERASEVGDLEGSLPYMDRKEYFLDSIWWEEATFSKVQEVLKSGADVNERDKYGWTPLQAASMTNPIPEIIQALVNAGADVKTRDNIGTTPLHRAAACNPNSEVIIVLMEAGANLNARNIDGWTPLHGAAAYSSNPMVVTVLQKAGADVNARNRLGATPLHVAAGHNPNPEVITVLLNAGANLEARDSLGATPLHSAARHNPNPDVIMLLLNAGADANARTREDKRPIDLTKENIFLKGTPAYWALHDASF